MTKDKEYIERDAATAHPIIVKIGPWEGPVVPVETVNAIPAADVVEVRHGRWNNGYEVQNCSECGYRGKRSYRYCPNCGAKMDGERKGGDE